jgi:hypothetical protein
MKKLRASVALIVIFFAPCAIAGSGLNYSDATAPTMAVSESVHTGASYARYRRHPKKKKDRAYWFWTATPPASGASPIYIGPYETLLGCRDMLGSAWYSHPFACHLTGPNPPSNCRVTGNGFAYPKDYPHPVPSDMYIPSLDCVKSSDPTLRLKLGWYFLYYTVNGGGVASCKEYKQYKELSKITPGMELGFYRNLACPGAPCFSVGVDTACN